MWYLLIILHGAARPSSTIQGWTATRSSSSFSQPPALPADWLMRRGGRRRLALCWCPGWQAALLRVGSCCAGGCLGPAAECREGGDRLQQGCQVCLRQAAQALA